MADLQPSSSDAASPDEDRGGVASGGDPRVVDLDSEDAEVLLEALSSETARTVLATLHDGPSTPSEVADGVDTSLQNAHYHLDNLREAGAVEVVDTAYSEKGREMDVYAPSDGPLVVLTGQEEERSGIRSALGRILGGVAAVGAGALAVQYLFGGDGGTASGPTVTDTTGTAAGGGIEPGLLFFAGGVTVLVLWTVAWYVGVRRSA